MSTAELIALVTVAIWLAVLTVAIVLVIRQIGLLTVRLTYAAPHSPADEHGPDLGTALPEMVRESISLNGEATIVVFLSGTCSPCREFISSASPADFEHGTVTLISGREELAGQVADMLPEKARRFLDPVSNEVAKALGIEMVPFGILIVENKIEAKTYLRTADDLERLREGDQGDQLVVVQSHNQD